MSSYCSMCRKNTKSVKTWNRRIMLLSKCAMCNNKKSKFIKGQKARASLGNLIGIKIPILTDLPIANNLFWKCKINAIVNKLLLAWDNFVPEMHLKQPGITYSACGPFT